MDLGCANSMENRGSEFISREITESNELGPQSFDALVFSSVLSEQPKGKPLYCVLSVRKWEHVPTPDHIPLRLRASVVEIPDRRRCR